MELRPYILLSKDVSSQYIIMLSYFISFSLAFLILLLLQIRKANIFDKDSLIPIFEGCDAVLSCLGGAVGFSRVTLYSDSIKAVTEAMRSANVKKIVVMSAAMCKGT